MESKPKFKKVGLCLDLNEAELKMLSHLVACGMDKLQKIEDQGGWIRRDPMSKDSLANTAAWEFGHRMLDLLKKETKC